MKVKQKTLGERSQTLVQLLYMEDLVRQELLSDIEERLESFVIDGILDTGAIEQLTEKHWLSPFPQFQTTERPDKCAAEILNGRILLLCDHSPTGILLPAVLNDFLQVSEDNYNHFEIVIFQRLIRYFALFLTLLFSGTYLAVTNFHTQVLPTNLILSFSEARQGVPFPALLEVLFMEIAFETIREAGVRMPGPLGGTIGIVGGLIVGQAAVEANLVSPIVVVVVAVTALCSLAIPNQEFSAPFRMLKFGFIFLGGTLGVFGILLGLYLVISHLAGLKSFGIPYLTPFAAQNQTGYRGEQDGAVRAPFRFLTKRPLYARRKEQVKLRTRRKEAYDMFADNARISHRQLFRQIVLGVIGIYTLVIPIFPEVFGKAGNLMFANSNGRLYTFLYLFYSNKNSNAKSSKIYGKDIWQYFCFPVYVMVMVYGSISFADDSQNYRTFSY